MKNQVTILVVIAWMLLREGCTVITFALECVTLQKKNEKLLAFRIALIFVDRWDTTAAPVVVAAVAAVEKEE